LILGIQRPVGDYQLDNDARSEKTFRVRSTLAACP
jgi:hypothetical protein